MDQPILCQDIHHIYQHPLSILIHLKFQDKDGCSRNGSKEFLIGECGMNQESYWKTIDKLLIEIDHRGVAIYIDKELIKSEVCREVMLRWKTLDLELYSDPIPIQSHDANILREMTCLDLERVELFIKDSFIHRGRLGVGSFNGRVVSIGNVQGDWDLRSLELCSTFPHLRTLTFPLEEFPTQISLFSDLIALKLFIKHEGCQSENMDEFSLLTKLRYLFLSSLSSDFNPSSNFQISIHNSLPM